tara:strand:+ start:862 stop:1083 length:222 start_codon:yes stop_codon:yes gene_type:complete
MKAGDLIKFDRINGHCPSLSNKVGLYLGEAFIHRNDGVVVENHRVLMVGEAKPTIIDRGLLRWMRPYDPNEEK